MGIKPDFYDALRASGLKVQYDHHIRNLLRFRPVISHILIRTLREYSGLSPLEASALIDPVHTEAMLVGESIENAVPDEGEVLYDLRFSAEIPLSEEAVPDSASRRNVSWQGTNLTTVGGKGGFASGNIHLTAGTKLYVYVWQKGSNRPATSDAFNGGGSTTAAGGGGATDVRTTIGDYSSRIIVAGGGGGGSKWGDGGHGGNVSAGQGFFIIHSGSNTPTGIAYTSPATQNSGAAFGNGGSTAARFGSGGGGWYGGRVSSDEGGGGGGSSYIAGYNLCNETQTSASGFSFTNCNMIQGLRLGNGYAEIHLISIG